MLNNIHSIITKVIKKYFKTLFILTIFLTTSFSYGQTQTNLNVFYSLVDSAVFSVSKQIPSNKKYIKLNLKLGNLYSIFEDRIISDFSEEGKTILPKDSSKESQFALNFAFESAEVKYGDMYREGIFGSFHVPRTISISGNYIYPFSGQKLHKFNYSVTDTVRVDQIKTIENNSYPFTQAQLPAEPFLPSLIEPVIAIGATALAVILFFTVRSK